MSRIEIINRLFELPEIDQWWFGIACVRRLFGQNEACESAKSTNALLKLDEIICQLEDNLKDQTEIDYQTLLCDLNNLIDDCDEGELLGLEVPPREIAATQHIIHAMQRQGRKHIAAIVDICVGAQRQRIEWKNEISIIPAADTVEGKQYDLLIDSDPLMRNELKLLSSLL